ncbi:MAG TPA: universal stress protein, partial [Chthoniobacteraceae bacterium]|nr:universal stress protein [Chthoniobacteraceae bacterium]
PSNQALRCAARLAEHFGGELTLLHIVQNTSVAPFPEVPPYLDYMEEDFESAERALQALAAQQTLKPSAIHTVVRTGLAAHEIVEAARDLDSDLIVIATHGYTGWKHLCIGSTAERVVRTAPCPVFVVREKQHELFS